MTVVFLHIFALLLCNEVCILESFQALIRVIMNDAHLCILVLRDIHCHCGIYHTEFKLLVFSHGWARGHIMNGVEIFRWTSLLLIALRAL